MVRQLLVQAVTGKPADREVDLRLAQQLAVLRDPVEQAGQHQPHGGFGVNPGPALPRVVAVADFVSQPGQVQYAIHALQNVVVGDEVPQGPGHEEVFLPACLPPEHPRLPAPQTAPTGYMGKYSHISVECKTFSTAPLNLVILVIKGEAPLFIRPSMKCGYSSWSRPNVIVEIPFLRAID